MKKNLVPLRMNPQGGQDNRHLEHNPGGSPYRVRVGTAHCVRVPLSGVAATPNLNQQHFLVPSGFRMGGGGVIHGHSLPGNDVRTVQAWNQAHFLRGTGPVVHQHGMISLNNISNVNPTTFAQQSQFTYNQAVVTLPPLPTGSTGPILLNRTPHGIFIQRKIQQSQNHQHLQDHQVQLFSQGLSIQRTQQYHLMPPQINSMGGIAAAGTQAEPSSFGTESAIQSSSYSRSVAVAGPAAGNRVLSSPQFQGHSTGLSGQDQQYGIMLSPLYSTSLTTDGSSNRNHGLSSPQFQNHSMAQSDISQQYSAMKNSYSSPVGTTAGSCTENPDLSSPPFQGHSTGLSGQSQQRIILRPPQFQVQSSVQCPQQHRMSVVVPRLQPTEPTTQPKVQSPPHQSNMNLPIGQHGISIDTAGIGRSSINAPHIVTVRSPKKPQAHQLPFSQLPGLNFSRTTEQDESSDSPKNGDFKIPNQRKRRPANSKMDAKDAVATSILAKSRIIANAGDTKSSSALQTKAEISTKAKKRRVQTDDHVMDQNAVRNESMKDKASQNECTARKTAKGGKKMLLASTTVNDQESTLRNPSNSRDVLKSFHSDQMTPAQRLIQRELKEVIESSTFLKGVHLSVDKELCHYSGVYVFQVLVFEKDDSTTDFPPIKMQVTEDYPAELPTFLDFKTIALSISNKKTRERFEQASRIFKKKLHEVFCMGEYQLRIPTLLQVWSLSLKETTIIPLTIFNARTQKKKDTPMDKR